MKKLITLVLVFFSVPNIYGQTALPPAYEITTDTISHNISLPDSCWQMMADPTGKMTLEQVLHSGNFHDTTRKIDYHFNTYWIRYRFENSTKKEINIALPEVAASVDLYIKSGNENWKHQHTGTLVPWSKRDGLQRITTITSIIPPGKQSLIYKKVYWNYTVSRPERMEVNFGFTPQFIQQNYIKNRTHEFQSSLQFFLLGSGMLAFIFYLYFYVIVREKEFLYFSLFVLFGFLNGISRVPDIFFPEHPIVPIYLIPLSAGFIYFFTIHFIRYFLKTYKLFPRWDKYLTILSLLPMASYIYLKIAPAAFYETYKSLNIFLSIATILIFNLSVLYTLLLYIGKSNLMTRLVIVGMAPIYIFDTCYFVLTAIYYIYFLGLGVSSAPSSILSAIGVFRMLFKISQFWMMLILAGILFTRFSSLRKKVALQEVEKEKERNALIAQQKIELEKQVAERTSELQQSLENLKSTQKQLIQSEKMASLGELTAGIAHEIQNPLNFVNNFSDVNKELISELVEEVDKKNYDEVKLIAGDIKENSEKINHHGKRAGDIVKGMLQHSRKSTGQKEPTDINALCDEYLRLSYHGLRAKDKTFNAEMKTDFDESLSADEAGIGKINIIPQDIGRVLLNLFNNAFYAASLNPSKGGTLEPNIQRTPTVWVKTKKESDKVIISVRDNGPGIPQNIVDKIFQPFFTTKPTGEGTGLGLSLSYDIVKAHGGELKVVTNEGEGSEFIIQLPLK